MSYERQVPDGMVLLVTLCKTRLFLLFLVLQFAFLALSKLTFPISASHLTFTALPCIASIAVSVDRDLEPCYCSLCSLSSSS